MLKNHYLNMYRRPSSGSNMSYCGGKYFISILRFEHIKNSRIKAHTFGGYRESLFSCFILSILLN